MQTGDGLLARLAPARGYFSAGELLVIAEAANECGNGTLEISKRGNLQVRGLSEVSAANFECRILGAGIAVHSGIAVLSSPLAARDPSETRDTSRIARAIRESLERATDLPERLSPKVSVIVDGGGRIDLSQFIADVRLKAMRTDRGAGWRLLVGGTESKARRVGWLGDDRAAVDTVMALLERLALRGRRARGPALDDQDFSTIPGLAAETKGAGEDDGKSQRPPVSGLPVGLLPMTSEKFALGLGLAFGATNAVDLSKLARTISDAGAGKIHFAPHKTILVPGLERRVGEELSVLARRLGFICDPADPRFSIMTCAGAPACASGYIETRPLAEHLVDHLGEKLDGVPRVHISGCEKRCADPGCPVVEIIGCAEGYHLSAGDVSRSYAGRDELVRAVGAALPPRNSRTTQTGDE